MIFGPIVVIVFAFIMNISKDYMLETMGRVEALQKAELIANRSNNRASDEGQDQPFTASDLVVPEQKDYVVVTERKFEIADLFATLVGKRARTVSICTF